MGRMGSGVKDSAGCLMSLVAEFMRTLLLQVSCMHLHCCGTPVVKSVNLQISTQCELYDYFNAVLILCYAISTMKQW